MTGPFVNGYDIVRVREIGSTQVELVRRLKSGEKTSVFVALHQTTGKGRLGRSWHSPAGTSLTVSMAFPAYMNHHAPHLIGMCVAIASAETLFCSLRWPNDLCFGARKVGGVLVEIVALSEGKLPVVGLGLNLTQTEFPKEIAETATSVVIETGRKLDAEAVLAQVLEHIAKAPEPSSWKQIEAAWRVRDLTPGKHYKMPDGKIAHAIGIGDNGALLCTVEGEIQLISVADAMFGEDHNE